jgi:hypothetical protein
MTLYLIAHKVRGERALDVATKLEMADGTWWIIPTSGHRAYPYWSVYLYEEAAIRSLILGIPEMPADLPDHYQKTEYTDRATPPPKAVPKLEDI